MYARRAPADSYASQEPAAFVRAEPAAAGPPHGRRGSEPATCPGRGTLVRKLIAIVLAILLNGSVPLWLNHRVGSHGADVPRGQTSIPLLSPALGWRRAASPANPPRRSRQPAGEGSAARTADDCIAAVLMPYCALADQARVKHRG